VRNLAQRSADAAKEIKVLIDESVGKVEGGVRLVHETGETIAEVVTAFQQLSQLVSGIAEASREQAFGIEQISGAVSQMDEVTQQNAALVEQAAAAAESLEEQAQGLGQTVSIFSFDGGLSSPANPANRASAVPSAPTFMPVKPKALPQTKRLSPPQFVDDEGAWAEF
jgi:methyl-accepting chemotaxis protein